VIGVWDTARGSELARQAYRYVAATIPLDANLDALTPHEDAALEAQRAGDFEAYQRALREMCRAAKREALEARRGAA